MQEVRRMLIERERIRRKIKDLEIKQKNNYDTFQNADLDIYEANRQLDDIEIRLKGMFKEIEYMEAICEELERKEIEETGSGFTAEKFQEREPEYWELRLANQMHRSQIGAQTGVGEGNYMSALNAAASPILPNSKNTIGKIPVDMNELAVMSLLPREGLKEKYLMIDSEKQQSPIED
jgi:hypothetical protein